MTAMLYNPLQSLVRMAAESPDPTAAAACAPVVMQQIPEEYDDELFAILTPDDWFERLAKIYPPIRSHHEWFKVLREHMLKAWDD
jgi:hypothetical protein